jgi:hypothetical protein
MLQTMIFIIQSSQFRVHGSWCAIYYWKEGKFATQAQKRERTVAFSRTL